MTKKLNEQQLEDLVEALNAQVNSLTEKNQSMAWDDAYGCYTRAGFEKVIWPEIVDRAKWIIYFDIDNMNALNAKHGKPAVNAMIKKSLTLRHSDYVAARYNSGDEGVICITENEARILVDPYQLCERLAISFDENGCPATFAIVPVISKELAQNVDPADEMVQASKNANRRGRILRSEGMQS
jgi:GGDEF domain-containing protein